MKKFFNKYLSVAIVFGVLAVGVQVYAQTSYTYPSTYTSPSSGSGYVTPKTTTVSPTTVTSPTTQTTQTTISPTRTTTYTSPSVTIPTVPLAVKNSIATIKSLNNQIINLSNVVNALDAQIKNIEKKTPQLAQTLSQKRKATITKLVSVAGSRKKLLIPIASQEPRAFLSLAFSKSQRNSFPKDIYHLVEYGADITGQLKVVHVDVPSADGKSFDPKKSKFRYFIGQRNQDIEIFSTLPISVAPSSNVRVRGVRIGNVIVPSTGTTGMQKIAEADHDDQLAGAEQAFAAEVSDTIGDQKTLILLVDYLDSPERPLTPEQAKNRAFGTSSPFQNFYKENSYNQVSFSGDVYGWVRMNKNFDLPCYGSGDLGLHSLEVKSFIASNGINLSNYGRLVFLVSGLGGGCGTVGKYYPLWNGNGQDTSVRLSVSWVGLKLLTEQTSHPFPWTYFDGTLSHEMGHNLGVMHANRWDCPKGDFDSADDCIHYEYGNDFDVMGQKFYSLNMNAYFKDFLGWIKPEWRTDINKTGRYTLSPLESDGLGVKVAKIINTTGKNVAYLEHRKAIGFDRNLANLPGAVNTNQTGVLINLVPTNFWTGSRIIDASPGTLDQFTLRPDTIPNTLKSEARGFTIGPVMPEGTTTQSVVFDVAITPPVCKRFTPKINYLSVSEVVSVGNKGHFYVGFTNNDTMSCADARIYLSNNVEDKNPDWVYIAEDPIDNTPAGNYAAQEIIFSVPLNAVPGNYTLTFRLNNADSGISVPLTRTVTVTALENPVATVVGTPNLELVKDAQNNEVSLKSSISFDVYAGKNDLKILKQWAIFGIAEDGNPNHSFSSYATYPKPADATDAGNMFIIPAGKKSTITTTVNFDPRIMKGGSYKVRIPWMYFGDYDGLVKISEHQTNAVTIVGELSPFITDITSPVAEDGMLVITGEKFHPTENTIKVGKLPAFWAPSTDGGTKISFKPIDQDILAGVYPVQVVHPQTGASNSLYVEITGANGLRGPQSMTTIPTSGRSVQLSWIDRDTIEDGFVVGRVPDKVTLPANTTNYVWNNLTPGTLHPFTLKSYKGAMESRTIGQGVYTWPWGDTDGTNYIDNADYARVDYGYRKGLSGWENGDFDNSKKVDADDYFIIDKAFAEQNAAIAEAEMLAPKVAEVKENRNVFMAAIYAGISALQNAFVKAFSF